MSVEIIEMDHLKTSWDKTAQLENKNPKRQYFFMLSSPLNGAGDSFTSTSYFVVVMSAVSIAPLAIIITLR